MRARQCKDKQWFFNRAAAFFVSYSFFQNRIVSPDPGVASFFLHSQPSEADAWSDKSGRPRNASTMRITMTV
jgi:hypothetical protein